MPAFGVYFVKFSSIALCAAALAASGVGKSGSPAPKSITSTPARRNWSTFAVTFMVGDPEMRFVRAASSAMVSSSTRPLSAVCSMRSPQSCRYFLAEPGLDHVGHQPMNAPAQGEHLFDQPRTDVGVLLRRHHEHRLDFCVQAPVHQRHLKLELEIGHRAEAAHDD